MRIALIHLAQETNDFNPVLTSLDDFRSFGILEGKAIIDELRGIGQIGGHFEAISQAGINLDTVPIIRAWAVAGGRISSEAYEFFEEKIRKGLEAAGPVDGLALQLHGACAAEAIDDVEGAQTALCRSILGPDVPIVVGLDHHANITQQLIDNSTAVVGHRTQPHDPFDTGRIGTELLIRTLLGEVDPVMAWRKIPLLSHQEQFLTSRGPMKTWFDRARAFENDPRVLQASTYPMQPWLDVAEGGWASIVVTDGEQTLADALADELADLAWSMRKDFQIKDAVAVDDAVRMAEAAETGIVVLSDTGDTVFGGSVGDSNVILEAVLRLGVEGKVLMPLISPAAVTRLVQAGEGSEVTLPLGGDAATEFFRPLEVTGTVRRIGGGPIKVDYNHQSHIDMGRVVIFEVGSVTLLISELRGVAGNLPDVYQAFGVDPRDYKMAVLKTASNFQYFAPLTSKVIRVDTPGPGQSGILTLPWKRLPRPIYPLDPIEDWRRVG